MPAENKIPSPAADELSAPYWDGTKRGEFLVQRCLECGKLRHYPQILCSECLSHWYDWIKLSGRGRVHSWTVTYHAFHPAFRELVPYALVTVDMEEGVRALGRLAGTAPENLKLGLPLRATFLLAEDGYGRLTFVPDVD